MNNTQRLSPGLLDGVHDSQQAFRAVLDALARPGQVRTIGPTLPGVALGGALVRLLLSLSDDETPVWWQHADTDLPDWLRFHTGATLAERPDLASFAVLTDPQQLPVLSEFSFGSVASPEFSCTVLIELPTLDGGTRLEWRGPGIETVRHVGLQGLPDDFWVQWQANHGAFPQGVDIVFTCGDQALGLPRTTRVRRLEGV
jgi:alpha-D-ribose 1-methylphosphonate 5-triphosphate synthase subunit PhnH